MTDSYRKMLEEFLQDLLFSAGSTENVNLLIEILLEMRGNDIPAKRGMPVGREPNGEPRSRCHLYKICSNGISWVGFVKGAEKTSEMLLGLNSTKAGFYCLYDESTGTVVQSPETLSRAEISGFLN